MNGSARLENNGARRTVCTGPVKGAKAPLKIAVGAVDPGKPTNVKHTQISKITEKNRKQYPDVKSRYAEPGRNHPGSSSRLPQASSDRVWERRLKLIRRETEKLRASADPRALRAFRLSRAESAYLDLVEADGLLDWAAAAMARPMSVTVGSSDPPAVSRSRADLLDAAVGALTATQEDGCTPMALLRASLAFDNRDHNSGGGGSRDRWPWAAEMLLLTSLSAVADGSLDKAVCLFAAGRFYADADGTLAFRFLDTARRVASDHRSDWRLPANVREATGVQSVDDGVWSAACFAQHEVLMRAATVELDTTRALRAVRAALRFAELSGLDARRRAPVAYKLGVLYAEVGERDRAFALLGECAVAAVGMDSGLDLEARLEMARLKPEPEPKQRDAVLERIADDALLRRDCRMLIKAIEAQARASVDDNRMGDAYRRFRLAQRLAAQHSPPPNPDDNAVAFSCTRALEDSMPVRLYAAMSRTFLFLRSNFRSLEGAGFDLLAEPRLWTADKKKMIIRSKADGKIFLNIDRLKDKAVETEAQRLIRRLRFGVESENATGSSYGIPQSSMASDSVAFPSVKPKKVLRF